MRNPAIVAVFSAIGTAISGICYFIISTPAHDMKAEAIKSNPNGDVVWLQIWEHNRQISLICTTISLAIFVWFYIAVWRAQRDDLRHKCSRARKPLAATSSADG